MPCIYKIESPTGKIYIGQTWNLSKRLSNYRKLRCKVQGKLFNSLNKYGFENHKFSILHKLPEDIDQKVLDEYEIFYISQYKECGFELLNLRSGGARGKHSQETIDKMKLSTKGKEFLEEYNKRPDRYKRPKGFYQGKRHPREYEVVQIGQGITKRWSSIKQVADILGYNKSNLSKAVRNKTKYKNSYWYNANNTNLSPIQG